MATPTGILAELISTFSAADRRVWEASRNAPTTGSTNITSPASSTTTWQILWVNWEQVFNPDRLGLAVNSRAFRRSNWAGKSIYVVIGADVYEAPMGSPVNQGDHIRPTRSFLDFSIDAPTITVSAQFGLVVADSGQSALVGKYVANDLQDVDITPPMLTGLEVNDKTLGLTFNEALDVNHSPVNSAFTITAGGRSVGVSGRRHIVQLSGAIYELKLASSVNYGETVTLAYTKPSTNGLRDEAGNELATFEPMNVTNNTPRPAFLYGSDAVKKMYYGSRQIKKMYYANRLVYTE